MGKTRNTGYLQNIVQYDGSNNIILPSLVGTGTRMVVTAANGTLSYQDIPTVSNIGGVPTTRTITINGTSQDLSANRTWTLYTDDISEDGSPVNLWFTNARARAAISVSGSLSYDSGTGVISYTTPSTTGITEGTNLYYTDARVGTYLTNNSYATQNYVSTQINNLVNGAPGLLDTLDELAQALGDDPNFSTTVTTALSNRLRIDVNNQGLTSTQKGYGRTNLGVVIGTDVQAWDADLDAIAALSGTSGFLKKTAANTWSLDTNTYLTSYTETDPYRVTSVAVTGTSTKTITLTRADSSTVTTTWTDYDTDTNTYVTSAAFSGGTLTLTRNDAGTVSVSLDGRYLQSYTETDTLATVTGRGATTTTTITADQFLATNNGNGTNFKIGDDAWLGDVNLANTTRLMGIQNNANAYLIFGNGDNKALGRAGTGALTYDGNTVYHSGNLTNLNQLTNGPGYITGYTETDTLASVTGRGASTASTITLSSSNPLHFTNNSNTGTYNKTVWYFNQNNTSADTGNGIFIERGRLTDSVSAEVRYLVIGARGGQIQWQVDGTGATTQYGQMKVSGVEMAILAQHNGTGTAWRGRIVSANSTANVASFLGNYNSKAGVFGHTNALDGWADLWVNTLGANGEGKVHLSNNTVMHSGDTEYAVLHAGNYTSYALPLNGNWSGNTGMNDQKLYLRTNGDNNHYLWNAADDYEELVYYTGTGFRVKGSTGYQSAVFSDSGFSTTNISGTGTEFYFGDWLSKRIKRFNVSGTDYKHKYILLMRVPTFGNVSVNCAVRGKLILERINGIGIDVHDEFQVGVSYANSTYYSMFNKCDYGTRLVNYTHNGVAYLALYVYSAPNYAIGMLECNITDYGGWLDVNYGLVVELSNANHTSASYTRWNHRLNNALIVGYDYTTTQYNVLTENQLYRSGGGDLYINSSGTGNIRIGEGGGSLLVNTGTKWNQEKFGIQISNSSNWSNVPAMMRLTNQGSGYRTKITFTDSSIIDGWLGMIPINNGSYFVMGFSGATEEGFKVYQNGNVVAAGDVTAYSDVRIKENIVTIDNALEKTLSLRGVYYNRIDTTDKRKKIGVIAQEVEKVAPELVTKMEDDMLNVSYGNMAGLFIEAIKEQQAQIEAQKSEIEELKELVKQLINK